MVCRVVQRGIAGIGALARTRDGRYVQVNGDVVAVLDARRIGQALRMQPARTKDSQWATHPLEGRLVADAPRGLDGAPEQGNSPSVSASRPMITVKQRRVAVRATTNASESSEQAYAVLVL